jgi:hypothetical protein
MADENPTDSTQDNKPGAKPSPKPGPRRTRPSPEEPEALHPEGDEPQADSTGSEQVEESNGPRERVTATHKADPIPAEAKKSKPTASEKPKAVSLAERMRFSRRIKPRR